MGLALQFLEEFSIPLKKVKGIQPHNRLWELGYLGGGLGNFLAKLLGGLGGKKVGGGLGRSWGLKLGVLRSVN